jgi:hypothetical protein
VQPLFPLQLLLSEWIVGFFVELFALGQMALGKFTSAGYVPDLDVVFVFRFSNAAPN